MPERKKNIMWNNCKEIVRLVQLKVRNRIGNDKAAKLVFLFQELN